MANKITIKKSSVANKAPTVNDLDWGELAINYTDGKLFYKKNTESDPVVDAFDTQVNYFGEDIQRCGFVDTQPYTKTAVYFNNTANFTVSPNSGETIPAYTFELANVGTSWEYYINGKRCVINTHKTVTLPGSPPAAATYFIAIRNNTIGTLSVSTSVWDLIDPEVIPVYIIKFNNALTPNAWPANERHTTLIDRREHYYNHTTKGSQTTLVGAITGYTLNNSTSDASITFGMGDSNILDEDIINDVSALVDTNGTTANYVIFYRTNSSTWDWELSIVPFRYTTNSFIQWDNNGTMTTTTTNGRYYTTYLLLTNFSGQARHIIVPGRGSYTSLANAQAEDITTFSWDGLGIAEYVICYKFIWIANNSYNTTGKVRLAVDPKRITVGVASVASISTASHNALSGLQGGNIGEYYHFTNAEYTALQQFITRIYTDGTELDQIKTATIELTLNSTWQDTGIDSDVLATGTYIVQLFANDGININEYYSGTMSWYSGSTQALTNDWQIVDEIFLHKAGGSGDSTPGEVYLRTFRSAVEDPDKLKLQIYSKNTFVSPSNYVFKFRRII